MARKNAATGWRVGRCPDRCGAAARYGAAERAGRGGRELITGARFDHGSLVPAGPGRYAGGRAIDDYTGIRGSVPNAQVYAPSGFGRIWSSVFLAGFFLFGGYRFAIEAFARSFDRLPAGAVPSAHALAAYAVQLPVSIIEAALLVAGPPAAVSRDKSNGTPKSTP